MEERENFCSSIKICIRKEYLYEGMKFRNLLAYAYYQQPTVNICDESNITESYSDKLIVVSWELGIPGHKYLIDFFEQKCSCEEFYENNEHIQIE